MVVWQSHHADVCGADGTLHQISIVGRDVTERRRFEDDLAYQATHDSLTGLPNRALLLDHLELALARAERDDRLIALLFLDLDRFKHGQRPPRPRRRRRAAGPDRAAASPRSSGRPTPWPGSAATSS